MLCTLIQDEVGNFSPLVRLEKRARIPSKERWTVLYFVLRIEHPETKKTVVIGIGFIDRGEALFPVHGSGFSRKDQDGEEHHKNKVDWGPDIDFTMKDGESIDIKMPTASSVTPKDSLIL